VIKVGLEIPDAKRSPIEAGIPVERRGVYGAIVTVRAGNGVEDNGAVLDREWKPCTFADALKKIAEE